MFASKKTAIVESIRYENGIPFFMAEYSCSSKNKLKQHLDMLSKYGTVKMTDYDGRDMSVSVFWKMNKGTCMNFGFIEYTEGVNSGNIFKYRVRMIPAY